MTTARLTAALLARKGDAASLHETYSDPWLDPILMDSAPPPTPMPTRFRGVPLRMAPPRVASRMTLRLDPETLARTRILAARRGVSLAVMVRRLIAEHLEDEAGSCACLAGDPSASCIGDPFRGGGCNRGAKRDR